MFIIMKEADCWTTGQLDDEKHGSRSTYQAHSQLVRQLLQTMRPSLSASDLEENIINTDEAV